jgi:hypothetical protein
MSIPLPQPPAAQVVLDDTPCRSCGYNLRTLAISGICPECSTPVAVSMRGNPLRHADPFFLRRLNAGTKICFWSFYFLILPAIFTGAPLLAAHILSIIASSCILLGTWFLTTPDPSGLGEAEYGTLRITTRTLGILQLCTLFFMMASFTAAPAVYLMTEAAAFTVQSLWGLCLLLFLRRLAMRTWEITSLIRFTWEIMAYLGMFAVISASTLVAPIGLQTLQLIFSRSWLCLIFLYSGLVTFSKALKPELAAARAPTLSRAAGSLIRSFRELFTGTDSDRNKPA